MSGLCVSENKGTICKIFKASDCLKWKYKIHNDIFYHIDTRKKMKIMCLLVCSSISSSFNNRITCKYDFWPLEGLRSSALDFLYFLKQAHFGKQHKGVLKGSISRLPQPGRVLSGFQSALSNCGHDPHHKHHDAKEESAPAQLMPVGLALPLNDWDRKQKNSPLNPPPSKKPQKQTHTCVRHRAS